MDSIIPALRRLVSGDVSAQQGLIKAIVEPAFGVNLLQGLDGLIQQSLDDPALRLGIILLRRHLSLCWTSSTRSFPSHILIDALAKVAERPMLVKDLCFCLRTLVAADLDTAATFITSLSPHLPAGQAPPAWAIHAAAAVTSGVNDCLLGPLSDESAKAPAVVTQCVAFAAHVLSLARSSSTIEPQLRCAAAVLDCVALLTSESASEFVAPTPTATVAPVALLATLTRRPAFAASLPAVAAACLSDETLSFVVTVLQAVVAAGGSGGSAGSQGRGSVGAKAAAADAAAAAIPLALRHVAASVADGVVDAAGGSAAGVNEEVMMRCLGAHTSTLRWVRSVGAMCIEMCTQELKVSVERGVTPSDELVESVCCALLSLLGGGGVSHRAAATVIVSRADGSSADRGESDDDDDDDDDAEGLGYGTSSTQRPVRVSPQCAAAAAPVAIQMVVSQLARGAVALPQSASGEGAIPVAHGAAAGATPIVGDDVAAEQLIRHLLSMPRTHSSVRTALRPALRAVAEAAASVAPVAVREYVGEVAAACASAAAAAAAAGGSVNALSAALVSAAAWAADAACGASRASSPPSLPSLLGGDDSTSATSLCVVNQSFSKLGAVAAADALLWRPFGVGDATPEGAALVTRVREHAEASAMACEITAPSEATRKAVVYVGAAQCVAASVRDFVVAATVAAGVWTSRSADGGDGMSTVELFVRATGRAAVELVSGVALPLLHAAECDSESLCGLIAVVGSSLVGDAVSAATAVGDVAVRAACRSSNIDVPRGTAGGAALIGGAQPPRSHSPFPVNDRWGTRGGGADEEESGTDGVVDAAELFVNFVGPLALRPSCVVPPGVDVRTRIQPAVAGGVEWSTSLPSEAPVCLTLREDVVVRLAEVVAAAVALFGGSAKQGEWDVARPAVTLAFASAAAVLRFSVDTAPTTAEVGCEFVSAALRGVYGGATPATASVVAHSCASRTMLALLHLRPPAVALHTLRALLGGVYTAASTAAAASDVLLPLTIAAGVEAVGAAVAVRRGCGFLAFDCGSAFASPSLSEVEQLVDRCVATQSEFGAPLTTHSRAESELWTEFAMSLLGASVEAAAAARSAAQSATSTQGGAADGGEAQAFDPADCPPARAAAALTRTAAAALSVGCFGGFARSIVGAAAAGEVSVTSAVGPQGGVSNASAHSIHLGDVAGTTYKPAEWWASASSEIGRMAGQVATAAHPTHNILRAVALRVAALAAYGLSSDAAAVEVADAAVTCVKSASQLVGRPQQVTLASAAAWPASVAAAAGATAAVTNVSSLVMGEGLATPTTQGAIATALARPVAVPSVSQAASRALLTGVPVRALVTLWSQAVSSSYSDVMSDATYAVAAAGLLTCTAPLPQLPSAEVRTCLVEVGALMLRAWWRVWRAFAFSRSHNSLLKEMNACVGAVTDADKSLGSALAAAVDRSAQGKGKKRGGVRQLSDLLDDGDEGSEAEECAEDVGWQSPYTQFGGGLSEDGVFSASHDAQLSETALCATAFRWLPDIVAETAAWGDPSSIPFGVAPLGQPRCVASLLTLRVRECLRVGMAWNEGSPCATMLTLKKPQLSALRLID